MHTYTPPYVDWPPPNGYLKILVDQQQGKIDIIPSYLTVSVRYYTCKLSTWNSSITTSNNNSNNSCKKTGSHDSLHWNRVRHGQSLNRNWTQGGNSSAARLPHSQNELSRVNSSFIVGTLSFSNPPLPKRKLSPSVTLCFFDLDSKRSWIHEKMETMCVQQQVKRGNLSSRKRNFHLEKAFLVGLVWVAVGWMLGRKGGSNWKLLFLAI